MSEKSTWTQVREGIVRGMDRIQITDGRTTVKVKRVYPWPPPSIDPSNCPCIVMYGSDLDDEWDGDSAAEHRAIEGYLMLTDEKPERATQLLELLREELKTHIRQHLRPTWDTNIHGGPHFDPPGNVTIGGITRPAIRFSFEVAGANETGVFASGLE